MAFNILLVDDSEIIRGVLARTLQMIQLPTENIYEASHGLEALDILSNKLVDLVVTDINMPQMGGVELVEKMSSDDELSDIPVVVVSTEGSSVRIKQMNGLGVRGYLRKPFTPEKIKELMVSVLGAWNE